MKKIKQLTPALLILSLIIGISSCKKEDIDVPDERLRDLFGEWEFLYSYGGEIGTTQYPTTNKRYKFTEKGEYVYLLDHKVESKSNFIFEADSYMGMEIPYHINFPKEKEYLGFPNNSNFIFKTRDTLELPNNHLTDCARLVYLRIN